MRFVSARTLRVHDKEVGRILLVAVPNAGEQEARHGVLITDDRHCSDGKQKTTQRCTSIGHATKHKQNERLKAWRDDSKYVLPRWAADPNRPVPWRNQELCQP
jgi:hypothetical protein